MVSVDLDILVGRARACLLLNGLKNWLPALIDTFDPNLFFGKKGGAQVCIWALIHLIELFYEFSVLDIYGFSISVKGYIFFSSCKWLVLTAA